MGKLKIASADTEKLVQDVANEIGLIQQGLEFKTLSTRKAKEMVKVSKAGDVAEVVSNKENLLIVVVYETAFDLLDDKAKAMLIRMELDKVVYDFEKDKVSLSAPMISVTLGSYQRYGNVATQHAELAIHTIQQLEEMEKQRKEEEKAAKSTRKKHH